MIYLDRVPSNTIVKSMCYPAKTTKLDRNNLFIIPTATEKEFLAIVDKFMNNIGNLKLRLPKSIYVPYSEFVKFRTGPRKVVNKNYQQDVKERKDRGFLKAGYLPSTLVDYNGFIDVSSIIVPTLSAKYTMANSLNFWDNIVKDRGLLQEYKYLVFTKENMGVKVNAITAVTPKIGLNSPNMYLNFLYNLRFHYDGMRKLLQENKVDLIFTDNKWTIKIDSESIPTDSKVFFKNLFTTLRRLNTGVVVLEEENDEANEALLFEDDVNSVKEETSLNDEKIISAIEKLDDKLNIEEKKEIEEGVLNDSSNKDKQLQTAIKISEIIQKSKEEELPIISDRQKKVEKRVDELKKKHLTEIVAKLEENEMEIIEKKKVNNSNVDRFNEFKIENMDKQYEKTAKKVRMEVGDNFAKSDTPLMLSNYKERDDDTSVDTKGKVVSYTFQSPNNTKEKHSFTVRVPELRDGKFLHLNGSDKVLIRQKMSLPIIKIKDRVLFTTYYGKMFFEISRGNISKIVAKVKRYIKYIRKTYTSKELNPYFDFAPAYFDCEDNNILSTELLEISRYFTKIHIDEDYITFENCKTKSGNKSGVIAYIGGKFFKVTPNNEIEEEGTSKVLTIADLLSLLFIREPANPIFNIWGSIVKKKETTSMAFSTGTLLAVDTPIILMVLHAMDENLLEVLEILKKDYGLEYKITPWDTKKPPKLYNENDGQQFLFDGFSLDVKYNNVSNRLLLEYLNNINTTAYDSLKMKGIIESQYNSRHIMNMENYRDYFIDNVASKQVMEDMGIPTNYPEALLYCNSLLTNYDRSVKEISLTNERMPSNSEIIHGVLYKQLANGMIDYSNKVKRGSKSAEFSVEKDAVIKELLTLPNLEESSKLNPIQHIDKLYTISGKGVSGVNEDRAYTKSKRRWDESFFGIMSDVSPFTKSSGISKHLAVNPNITDMKGYFKSKKPQDVKPEEIMAISETLAPFAQRHDSAARLAMFMSQMNHTVNVQGSEQSLVTYGMDDNLYELDTDFVHKVEDDAEIVEFNDKYVKVKYLNEKNSKGEPILKIFSISKIERNAAKAKYILNDMILNPKLTLKIGKILKKGTVIAYNKDFYQSDGVDITYKPGPIAWVALTNNQLSYEDATVMCQSLATKLGTKNLKRIAIKLHPRSKIVDFKKIEYIQPGDVILKYSEDTGSDFYNNQIDTSTLDDYLLNIKKSNHRGNIRDIFIYYKLTNEEYENMDPSIKGFMDYVEKYYNTNYNTKKMALGLQEYEKNSDTDHVTKFRGNRKAKVNGDSVDNGEILIEYFIEVETPFSVGDKLIFGSSALKGVCSKIVEDEDAPIGVKSNRRIDAILSTYSPSSRMVYSLFMVSLLTGAMIQMNNHIRENILNLEKKW